MAIIAVRPCPKFFGVQQRHLLAFGRVHVGVNLRTRFGRAGLFVIHEVRKLLPFFGVGGGVVDQARDDAVDAIGCKFGCGVRLAVARILLAMEGAGLSRERGGQQIGDDVRGGPASIGERKLTAQEQKAAAAAIDEIVDQSAVGRGVK